MKCSVCGRELDENTGLCRQCGNAGPAPEPTTPPASKKRVPPSQRRKRKKRATRAVSVLVVLLAAVLVAGAVIWNLPMVRIPLALSKSAEALSELTGKLTTVMAPFYNNSTYSTSTTLEFSSLSDYAGQEETVQWSQFAGAVIQLNGQMTETDRRYSGDLTLTRGDTELLRATYGLDRDTAWLSVPALLESTYGLKVYDEAEALRSLAALGIDTALLEGLDLNHFNASKPKPPVVDPQPTVPPATNPAPTEPVEEEPMSTWELLTSIKMGWLGRQTLNINGNSLECIGYSVVIPGQVLTQEPVKTYYDSAMKAAAELYAALAQPEGSVKLSAPEELELELYLHGGYIVGLKCGLLLSGTPLTVTVAIGGTDTYINSFSLVTETAGTAMGLSASGNHTGQDAYYSTQLVYNLVKGSEKSGFSADLVYLPQVASHNFSCDLALLETNGTLHDLKGTGQLTLAGQNLELDMKWVDWDINGKDQATVNIHHTIGDYAGAAQAPEVSLVNGLDEAGVKDVQKDLLLHSQKLILQLMKEYPMLKDVLLDKMMEMFGS